MLVMRALGGASSLSFWGIGTSPFRDFNSPPPKVVVFPLAKPTPCSALSGRLLVNELYLDHWPVQLPISRYGKPFCLRWQKGDRPDNDLVEPCIYCQLGPSFSQYYRHFWPSELSCECGSGSKKKDLVEPCSIQTKKKEMTLHTWAW